MLQTYTLLGVFQIIYTLFCIYTPLFIGYNVYFIYISYFIPTV